MKEKIVLILKKTVLHFMNRWTLLALLFAAYSLLLLNFERGILYFSYTTFFFSVVLTIAFWNTIGGIVGLLPKYLDKLVIAIIAFIIPGLFTIGTKSFFEFKAFLDSNVLLFAYDDPKYFTTLLKVHLNNKLNLFAHLLVAALFYLFLTYKVKRKKNYLPTFILAALVIGIGQNQFGRSGNDNFTAMEARYVFTIKKYLKERDEIIDNRKVLTRSYYRMTPEKGNTSDYNIVLIFHESMSKEPIPIFGYDNDYMPFLQQWYENEKENFVLFSDAMTISGCTDMSTPSTLTGAEPEATYEKFMYLPFMWDYAKVNGYKTAFLTPQQFGWKEFEAYYNNKNLDYIYSAENTNLEYANDLGIDDVAFSEEAVKLVKSELKDDPFFIFYGSNALHYPYQGESDYVNIPKNIKDHYGKTLYIVDKSMNNLYDALDEMGALENTIFIFSSDHGQYTSERLSRLGSFYLEALQIPMFVKFPDKWIQENQKDFKKMKANKDVRVTNLDLMPTFLDLIQSSNSNKGLRQEMKGSSLFSPIDNNRTIVCLSTNEFRVWSNEGLGVYRDTMSYIIDNVFKEQLYNLKKDPNQVNNLIEQERGNDFVKEVYEIIENNPALKRIHEEYAK